MRNLTVAGSRAANADTDPTRAMSVELACFFAISSIAARLT